MDGQVFISYSRRDSEFAHCLSEALAAKGFKTWLDMSSIQIGSIWREEIVNAIERSTYFVVLLSSRSIYSDNVSKELSIAESANVAILPVLIDDVKLPARMKYQLAGVQFIRFQDHSFEEGVSSLLSGMRASSCYSSEKEILESVLFDRDLKLLQTLSASNIPSTFRAYNSNKDRTEIIRIIPGANRHNFKNEALRLEKLRLQGVPALYDHFQREDWYCLIQEDVQAIRWDQMNWSDPLFLDSVHGMLKLLTQIHSSGILHGNIHPKNLLIDPYSNRIFLVGFGLPCAELPQDSQKMPGLSDATKPTEARHWPTRQGGQYFKAPELIRFDAISSAVDVYSLAVSILVLRTGMTPDQLYNIEAGCWRLEAIDHAQRSWLEPMLDESPSIRLRAVKDLLDKECIESDGSKRIPKTQDMLFNSSTLPDASGCHQPAASLKPHENQPVTSSERWLRQRLLDQLLVDIGPIARLFLEDVPEQMSAHDLQQLMQQLREHGLDHSRLDQIIKQSQERRVDNIQPLEATNGAASIGHQGLQDEVLAESSPTVGGLAQPLTGNLYHWLLEAIGPAAELIWDHELESCLAERPESIREKLASLGLDDQMITELVRLAKTGDAASIRFSCSAGSQSEVSEANNLATKFNTVAESAFKLQSFPDEARWQDSRCGSDTTRSIVLQELGPMGISLLAECQGHAVGEELITFLASRMRQLSLEEEVIARVCDRLKTVIETSD